MRRRSYGASSSSPAAASRKPPKRWPGPLSASGKNPWPVFDLTHEALKVAAHAALGDRACARQLLPALQEPFAASYADNQRRMAACLVASRVAPQDTAPLVESYEPNVPWYLAFLTLRADAYDQTRNPLAAKADSDLALFLRNEAAEK